MFCKDNNIILIFKFLWDIGKYVQLPIFKKLLIIKYFILTM